MKIKTEADQLKAGVAALAVCIVQTLCESDPTIPERLEPRLVDWQEKLADRGEPHAAELLYMILRALHDRELFPPFTPE